MTLREELKDICEVDRLHRCYELTFDDGSTARAENAAQAREIARLRSWEVAKIDGYNKPLCAPVFVRAATRERAEEAGKFWLKTLGIKGIRRVRAIEYRPAMDPDYGRYIFRAENA